MLTFQRLIVYQRALELFTVVAAYPPAPRGYAELGEQLRRAAMSIPANIAEGAGRLSPADAARFYGIARGSAMECAAHLDCLQRLGAVDEPGYATALGLLKQIVAMLTTMLKQSQAKLGPGLQSPSQSKSKLGEL